MRVGTRRAASDARWSFALREMRQVGAARAVKLVLLNKLLRTAVCAHACVGVACASKLVCKVMFSPFRFYTVSGCESIGTLIANDVSISNGDLGGVMLRGALEAAMQAPSNSSSQLS